MKYFVLVNVILMIMLVQQCINGERFDRIDQKLEIMMNRIGGIFYEGRTKD